MNSEIAKPGWRNAGIALGLLFLLTIVLYQQTLVYLTSLWNEISVGEYAHGYLVLAISVYLIVNNRKRLLKVTPRPSYAILPLVLLASMGWLIAVLVDVEMLQTVGLLLIILSVVWAVTGHQAMTLLAFPLLFIAFAIPIWFPLSPLLQDWTAEVVFWMARLLEVPAFRQENTIAVPSGVFSIEEACSGLRYLLAAMTLGSFYAYINYVTLPARLAVVLVAAITAIVANILRVFIVVYLGYVTEMQHPWVADHLMLGWYLFGGLVAIMLFLDSHFYRHEAAIENPVVSSASLDKPCTKKQSDLFVISLLCLILLLPAPAVVYQKDNQQYPSASAISINLPAGTAGWRGPFDSANDWMPVYEGAISQKMDYQKKADAVSLYIAYYPWQKQGKEVINDLNQISNKKVWRLRNARARSVHLDSHDVMEQVAVNGQSKKRLIWYWYDIGGQVTTNKYEAKVLQLTAMLRGQPQAYVVAVSVGIKYDIEDARESLREYVTAMKAPLASLKVKDKTGN